MRRQVITAHHVSSTCRMGPKDDPMAVVDQYGRVHGAQGLRVIDASIMPEVVRANPNLTVMAMGGDGRRLREGKLTLQHNGGVETSHQTAKAQTARNAGKDCSYNSCDRVTATVKHRGGAGCGLSHLSSLPCSPWRSFFQPSICPVGQARRPRLSRRRHSPRPRQPPRSRLPPQVPRPRRNRHPPRRFMKRTGTCSWPSTTPQAGRAGRTATNG